MSSSIPIGEQIAAAERALTNWRRSSGWLVEKGEIDKRDAGAEEARLQAVIRSLKFFERHEAAIKAHFGPPRTMHQADIEEAIAAKDDRAGAVAA